MIKRTATEYVELFYEWRRKAMPYEMAEAEAEAFANGEKRPSVTCDDVPSLGLARKHALTPYNKLVSVVSIAPGPLKAVHQGLDMAKFQKISKVANETQKSWVKNLIQETAGGVVCRGRNWAFSTHKKNPRYSSERVYHPEEAEQDTEHDNFWAWAVHRQITLSEVESALLKTKGQKQAEGGRIHGWDHQALRALKEYFLEERYSKAGKAQSSSTRSYSDSEIYSLSPGGKSEIIDCCYFFEKQEEKDKYGRRKVDMSIVFLNNYNPTVKKGSRKNGEGRMIQTTSVSVAKGRDADEDRILFHMESYYDYIQQCIIPVVVDHRISKDQRMLEAQGFMKHLIPRMTMLEVLYTSLAEGAGYGAQPNFQLDGTKVEQRWLESLQEKGIQPWQVLPPGLNTVDKSNSLASLGQILQIMGVFSQDIDNDSASGDVSLAQGNRSLDRKSVADKFVAQVEAATTEINQKFVDGIDTIVREVGKKLMTPMNEIHESDHGYYDVFRFQEELAEEGGISHSELQKLKPKFRARTLTGSQTAEQAIRKAVGMKELVNDPQIHRKLDREIIAANYGEDTAEEWLNPDGEDQKEQQRQAQIANEQLATAAATYIAPEPSSSDDPTVHNQVNLQALQVRIGLLSEQGKMSLSEQAAAFGMLKHAGADAQRLPEAAMEQTMAQLQEFSKALQQIPVTQPEDQEKEELEKEKMKAEIRERDSLVKNREDAALMKAQQADVNLALEADKRARADSDKDFENYLREEQLRVQEEQNEARAGADTGSP